DTKLTALVLPSLTTITSSISIGNRTNSRGNPALTLIALPALTSASIIGIAVDPLVTDIDFSSLTTGSPNITIDGLTALTRLLMPSLQTAYNIGIYGSPNLTEVGLGSLAHVTVGLYLSGAFLSTGLDGLIDVGSTMDVRSSAIVTYRVPKLANVGALTLALS